MELFQGVEETGNSGTREMRQHIYSAMDTLGT